ncbi:P-loop NTPase fold protein [Flavobacterium defluvii]|uniref:KAP family P-loop domain-containing protein n=1 Tax=Flavobacterium defluvii TaxID=370979 RepID=A0A1M5U198_9FLAO|nr:P-loop NTPase fold protein [Flavobacterium defluvii]SHH56865.1 KAP family P-loop domain-containing protein [Flavobacterium defluvii]
MGFATLSIDSEITRFAEHLSKEDNNRILFSGIFGIGKTYFIEKFFESREDYISIKLSPVNYAVSANQDIFELIKFDIAFQLLALNPDFQKTNFDKVFAGQFYVLENYKNIIGDLIMNLSKLDHQVNSILEPAVELGKKIKEYTESINVDEEKDLKEFLNFFKDQKGTIREENNISELLTTLIYSLKQNEVKKDIVLVIDDLDRIDPEHIFRLLNVFSAHFDFQELVGVNKFGFDKVILICDIENIRGIFHNKYGAEIDFSGYIDKFYSKEIYYYKIEEVIKNNLKIILTKIRCNQTNFATQISSQGTYIHTELQFLFSFFIDSGSVSLRNLISFIQKEIVLQSYSLQSVKLGIGRVYSSSTPILFILGVLEQFFGSKINFIKAIDKAIDKFPLIYLEKYNNYSSATIGNLAMLAGYSQTQLLVSSNDSENYKYIVLDYTIEYKTEWYNHSYGIVGYMQKIYQSSELEKEKDNHNIIFPYFQLFKNAYAAYNEIVKKTD